MVQILRIAMLNADIPVPTIHPIYPTYGRIFHNLLSRATDNNNPNLTIQSTDFNVKNFEYPPSPHSFDAIIISGSASSAYDDEPWIHELHKHVREVYEKHPHVKFFGSCFGHQILCSSLLSPHGAHVEPDPQGWEIGVHDITFHKHFLPSFPFPHNLKETERIRLQFVHHDHVVLPTPPTPSLPSSWMTVGRTPHCAVQGVYQPGRVFTLQGHFEFDRVVNREVAKYFFGKSWEAGRLEGALEDIDQDDDAGDAAGMVLAFLVGKDGGREDRCGLEGGLLTPPGEG